MERRRANDGQAYTEDEFGGWYHAAAQEYWENAPQLRQARDGNWYTEAEWTAWETGNAEEAPAAEQHQAAGAPPGLEQHQAAGAPAGAAELAAEQLWGASNFVTVLLPQNGGAAAGIGLCRTLRELLQAAHAHREHLPLPADLFFNGNIRVALGCPDALIVSLESIHGIRDPNRSGHDRIDMLVYHHGGAVTRYHPGGTPAQSAQPHTIPHGSRTYSRAIALDQGVGAALHVHAPGLGGEHVAAAEHDAPPLLVTADDLADINPVDSKLVNAASLRAALASLPPGETNWSYEGFPWWVFMAGRTQRFHTIVREGIIRVIGVSYDDLTHCMRVTTREGVRVVSVNRGQVRVE